MQIYNDVKEVRTYLLNWAIFCPLAQSSVLVYLEGVTINLLQPSSPTKKEVGWQNFVNPLSKHQEWRDAHAQPPFSERLFLCWMARDKPGFLSKSIFYYNHHHSSLIMSWEMMKKSVLLLCWGLFLSMSLKEGWLPRSSKPRRGSKMYCDEGYEIGHPSIFSEAIFMTKWM